MKKILGLLSILAVVCFALLGARPRPVDTAMEVRVWRYVSEQLDTLQERLAVLHAVAPSADREELLKRFNGCRAAYKRVEAFVEHQYPTAALRVNGAALLEAEPSEPEEPQHPTGFQVLEDILFGEDSLTHEARIEAVNELSSMAHDVRRVRGFVSDDVAPVSSVVFEALRLNFYRLIAKGITGFDSPVLLASMDEGAETLEGFSAVMLLYGAPAPLLAKAASAEAVLRSAHSFDDFDRAAFLTQRLLPLMEEFHRFQRERNISFEQHPRAVRADAAHFFEKDAFYRFYFAPAGTAAPSPELIALGQTLFYDPALSSTGKRSCGSCHDPAKAFTDRLAVNASLTGDGQLLRNTPTLINAALQPAQFADSRIAFLEDQIHDVVSNKREMGGDFAGIVAALKKQKRYQQLFSEAFPTEREPWRKTSVKQAVAAYVRSLVAMNSRFDSYMRGEEAAMNVEEVRGFNLFMGKAGCGTCHYAPLFSGAVPPLYDKMESEVLGVPANTDTLHAVLDADLGKYHLYRMPHQRRSFKTPGLRNVALTAPYMHNGVYKTLDEVMNFYDRGGGAAMGLDVPNQTLPTDRLGLSADEKRAVIAFMETLTDTVVATK